jgi:type IV fimbrial biogenesis protein FimT
MKIRSRGFTLLELMITLVLAAVVLGLGVPSFRDFQRNNRLTVSANDMLSLAISSRNEALRRQAVVSLCPSANPTSASATCGTGSGWISFIDTNDDCARAAGEELVSNAYIASDVNAVANSTCIKYASTGYRVPVAGQPSTANFLYCDSRGNVAQYPSKPVSTARAVEVLPTGRGSVVKYVSEISALAGVACP